MKWLAFLGVLLHAFPAFGQMACMSFEELRDKLAEYGEAPIFAGTNTAGDETLFVFLDPDDGSWSIVVTSGQGHAACMPLDGMNGMTLDPPQPPAH